MSINYAEIADHLSVAVIEGISMKNAAVIKSGNLSQYKPIAIDEVIDIYCSIYKGIKDQIKE